MQTIVKYEAKKFGHFGLHQDTKVCNGSLHQILRNVLQKGLTLLSVVFACEYTVSQIFVSCEVEKFIYLYVQHNTAAYNILLH